MEVGRHLRAADLEHQQNHFVVDSLLNSQSVQCAQNRLALNRLGAGEQEAFEKCWAHSPLRAVLHCHSPGVATRRLCIDVHDDDDDKNDNA